MRRTFFLAVLLTAAAWHSSAQAPGYLGKRFFVKPETALMFAIKKPTAGNRGWTEHFGESSGSLGLNSCHGLQFGYALSRRHVLAFEAGYIKTGMTLTANTPSTTYEGYTDNHALFYHLSGIEYGLSWQTYNPLKGSLAPMGFFTAWHLKAAPMKGKIVDKQTFYGGTDVAAGHAPLGIDARYTHWSVGVEVGQHLVLFDRLMLALSAELNLSPLQTLIDRRAARSTGDDYNQLYFNQAAFDRMKGHSLFMIKLGAGYLL